MAIVSQIQPSKKNPLYVMVHLKATRIGTVVTFNEPIPMLKSEAEEIALVPGDELVIE